MTWEDTTSPESSRWPSLRDAWEFVFRRWRLLVLTPLSATLAAAVAVQTMTPKYYVYSTLLVERSANRQQPLASNPAPYLGDFKAAINSETQIVLSRPVLERVVDAFPDLDDRIDYDASARRRSWQSAFMWPVNFGKRVWHSALDWSGLATVPTAAELAAIPRQRALERLQPKNNIVLGPSGAIVRAVEGADVIDIGLVAGDPVYAQRVVDAIVHAYLEQRLRLDQAGGPADFFGDQVSAVRTELARSRERLRRFQESEGIVSHEKQESVLLDQLTTVSDALLKLRQEVIDRRARLDSVRRRLAEDKGALVPSQDIADLPDVQRLSARLVDLRLERFTLLQQYVESSAPVARVDVAIRETEASLRRQVGDAIKLMEGSLDTDRARVEALELERESLRAQLGAYPRQMQVVTTLMHEIDDQQKLLSTLLQKLGEERIAAAADRRVENVKILRPAAYSPTPQSPRGSIVLLVGAVLGLLTGLGLALLAESLDHSIRSEQDVTRYLNLPTLTSVGVFKGSSPGGLRP